MSKPMFGIVVGTILGVLDGAPAWAYPKARPMIGAIVGFATQRFPRGTAARRAALACVIAVAASASASAQGAKTDDPLQPVAFLLGTWKGTSTGQPGEGTVEREYTRALNGRFIHVRNRSTYPPQPRNPKGETHEDVGFISFDKTRTRFVLRQFHVEGFVNQYSAETPSSGEPWVFTSEAIENIPAGWRARETYTIQGNVLEEVFELAEPGKEFKEYSRTRLLPVR